MQGASCINTYKTTPTGPGPAAAGFVYMHAYVWAYTHAPQPHPRYTPLRNAVYMYVYGARAIRISRTFWKDVLDKGQAGAARDL